MEKTILEYEGTLKRLQTLHKGLCLRKHSFVIWVINDWKYLPSDMVTKASIPYLYTLNYFDWKDLSVFKFEEFHCDRVLCLINMNCASMC